MAFFMEDMLLRKSIFAHAKETYFYAFRKSGFSDYVKENASSNNITLVTVDDLFEYSNIFYVNCILDYSNCIKIS